MTWDQWTAVIASIGSCAAAIAAFMTIRQVAKNTAATYRPELAILQTVFDCRSNPITNGNFPGEWSSRPGSQLPRAYSEIVVVPLKNFGNGAARKIEIKWSFPMKETVARINELAEMASRQCRLELSGNSLKIRAENGNTATAMWFPEAVHSLEYLLAAPGDPAPTQLDVPPSYMILVAALVHLDAGRTSGDGSFPLPELTADFSYLDMGGNRHKRKHVFRAEIVLCSGQDKSFSGMIETGFRA